MVTTKESAPLTTDEAQAGASSSSPHSVSDGDGEATACNDTGEDVEVEREAKSRAKAEAMEKSAQNDTSEQTLSIDDLPWANPRNWPYLKRAAIAVVIWLCIGPVDMTAAAYSGGTEQIIEEFQVTRVVAVLGVSLANLGISIGPVIGAPLSETFGRKPVYLVSMAGFVAFSAASGGARNIQTLLITRFVSGLFAGPPFSVCGGSLGDLFTDEERGPWVAIFTLMLQGAPSIAPVWANWMGQTVSWRWILYAIAIFAAFDLVLLCLIPETQPGIIVRNNAQRLRKERGAKSEKTATPAVSKLAARLRPKLQTLKDGPDERHAEHQLNEKLDASQGQVYAPIEFDRRPLWRKITSTLARPLVMLVTEPMLLSTTIYHAFIYSLLFMLLEIYPLVYERIYSLSLGLSGTAFVAPWLGNALGVVWYFAIIGPKYAKLSKEGHATPETRLPSMVIAAILLPVALFWFAYTTYPSVHPVVSMASGVLVGAGMVLLQLALNAYYIDVYAPSGRAASALAANVMLRNLLATASPLYTTPMYDALGPQNASVILAAVACLGLPMSLLLIWKGKHLRQKSKIAQ
ncbi:Synaptic vesicle transporter SVOP and related transporters (major facilitator superfamily) [Ceraceosorus bombacis]|uniref:Synaptic vesicle transporter SVOP and related transporters (Major facilitator superfamily) n=1 Tax=Ceraceosorus bombacis TaxID=401625 RepID=A0A0P1BH41_9BASI|nr:Synaptic vesicle transporter SVOP and related transporters (major facilitator superfamily) [Ceraceosorus bombacis]